MLRNRNSPANSGLRTKYFPKSRIGHGLISAAPWLNVILLVICFVMLESKFVLQQGVVVDLPTSSFKEMIQADLIIVVRSVEVSDRNRKEIVFFDDERFLLSEELQMDNLKKLLMNKIQAGDDTGVLIYADSAVMQGTLITIFDMVRDAGGVKVNIATRPQEMVE